MNLKGILGLKQGAFLANNYLKVSLVLYSYKSILGIISIWKHKSSPIIFYLYIDDFGVKYWFKEDTNYLYNAIGVTYKCTVDREGQHYCGLNLDWNYALRYLIISIPKYVSNALKKSCAYQKFHHSILLINIIPSIMANINKYVLKISPYYYQYLK